MPIHKAFSSTPKHAQSFEQQKAGKKNRKLFTIIMIRFRLFSPLSLWSIPNMLQMRPHTHTHTNKHTQEKIEKLSLDRKNSKIMKNWARIKKCGWWGWIYLNSFRCWGSWIIPNDWKIPRVASRASQPYGKDKSRRRRRRFCLRSSRTSREMKISRTWFTSRVAWQMTIDEELTPPTMFNSGEKRKQYEDMELGSISLFKAHGIIYIFNKIIVNKSRIQKFLFLSWKIGFGGRESQSIRRTIFGVYTKAFAKYLSIACQRRSHRATPEN